MAENMQQINSMEEAVSFLEAIPRFVGEGPEEHFRGLKEFYEFMDLEDPARTVFHIAGTNGKGSVCAFLSSLHERMGVECGVFTSPHLFDIKERIVCGGEKISDSEFMEHFRAVADALSAFRQKDKYRNFALLYFDYMFFLAASYYAKKRPKAVIWETGLGGRFDATNTVIKKDVAVITEIGLDHMAILGDTKEKIAGEKAGIIKAGVPVISVDRCTEVTSVIRGRAKAMGAHLRLVPGYEKISTDVHDKIIDFSYESDYYNNVTLEVACPAVYQTENAYLALKAMECVYGREVTPDVMSDGVSNMRWPGRFEKIDSNIYYDGAHNADGMEAFLKSVAADGCKGKRSLLFCAVTDKQSDTELNDILRSGCFCSIALAPMHNERSIDTNELNRKADVLKAGRPDMQIEVYDDLIDAYEKLVIKLNEEDVLYVCGSLYIYGELVSKGLIKDK